MAPLRRNTRKGKRAGAPLCAKGDEGPVTPTANTASEKTIQLKDPWIAAVLAWLVPGLGHLYQGRIAKGVLFFVCLMGTFAYGCYLGGNSEVGRARVVYIAWNEDDTRLPFVCQAGMGLPVLPALMQSSRVRSGNDPRWGGFMAPPIPDSAANADKAERFARGRVTLNELHFSLRGYFELGTVYTMIAGLLNILAIYDAWAGPVFIEEEEDEDEDENSGQEDAEPAATK